MLLRVTAPNHFPKPYEAKYPKSAQPLPTIHQTTRTPICHENTPPMKAGGAPEITRIPLPAALNVNAGGSVGVGRVGHSDLDFLFALIRTV